MIEKVFFGIFGIMLGYYGLRWLLWSLFKIGEVLRSRWDYSFGSPKTYHRQKTPGNRVKMGILGALFLVLAFYCINQVI